ncbi:ankyrin repeat-containing domain protein [Coprinopsis sp. MPI-PUGE-AT-0042]|nr:ankyrin repeat-containing domain protein [Coprinopsis sp. MPI-PUGE-AT-0042]
MGAQISFLDGPPASTHLADMPGYLDDPEANPGLDGVSILEGPSDSTINGGTFNAAGRDIILETATTTVNNITINFVDTTPLTDIAILYWLSAINYRAIQMDNFEKATPNTCLWFFKSEFFRKWLLGQLLILWGTGMPGAGKTVLAAIVIDYLQEYAKSHGPKVAVAFAYCRYTESVPVQQILAALVRQLLERYPFLYPLVKPLYDQHSREMTKPSKDQLLQLLRDMSQVFETFFCGLDGLDEAAPDTQFKLIDALSTVKARFFITSRPLEPLHSALPNAHFFNIVARDHDIRLMVAQKLRESPRVVSMLNAGGKARQEEVVSKITSNANGMFLHATMQTETVLSAVSIRSALDGLDKFPLKVSDMYIETLKRIDAQPQGSSILARRALLWLLHVQQPVRLDDLRYALVVNTDFPISVTSKGLLDELALADADTLLSICCGLIIVENTGMVRLVHKTAYESLPLILGVNQVECHAMLAIACMRRLLSVPYPWPHDLPLVVYAQSNWCGHIALSEAVFTSPSGRHLYELIDFFHLFSNLPDTTLHTARIARYNGERIINTTVSPPRCHDVTLADPSSSSATEGTTPASPATPPLSITSISPPSRTSVARKIRCPSYVQGRDRPLNVMALQTPDFFCTILAMSNVAELNDFIHEVMIRRFGGLTLLLLLLLPLPASKSYAKCFRAILDFKKLRVNFTDEDGMTVLHHAVRNHNASLVKALLQRPDIDVNAISKEGLTPLLTAVIPSRSSELHASCLQILLHSKNLRINLPDKNGMTILHHAVHTRNSVLVRVLLQRPDIDVNAISNEGLTLLSLSRYWGPSSDDCPMNNRAPLEGFTAPMLAVARGSVSIVDAFMTDPSSRAGIDASSALITAIRNSHRHLVLYLLLHHPHAIQKNAWIYCFWWSLCDDHLFHTEVLQSISTDFVGLHLVSVETLTILCLPEVRNRIVDYVAAASEGNTRPISQMDPNQDTISAILLHLPAIPGVDNLTDTPFMAALRRGQDSIAARLLSFPHLRADLKGILEGALERNNWELCKLILACPAFDVSPSGLPSSQKLLNIIAEKGSLLLITSMEWTLSIMEQVLSLPGFDINATDADGWTPLMWAVWNGRVKVVQRLLRIEEINISIEDPHGQNAWCLAIRRELPDIAKLLETHDPPAEKRFLTLGKGSV